MRGGKGGEGRGIALVCVGGKWLQSSVNYKSATAPVECVRPHPPTHLGGIWGGQRLEVGHCHHVLEGVIVHMLAYSTLLGIVNHLGWGGAEEEGCV